MISELFLTTALALPIIFSEHGPTESLVSYANRATFRFLLHTLNQEYPEKPGNKKPLVLLVDDSADLVESLRQAGIQSWAMTAFSSMSPYQFEGQLFRSPIRAESVHVAYLADPVRQWDYVRQMIRMVKPWGFMLLNLTAVPMFDEWLRQDGWERLPFTMSDHSVYRRGKRVKPSMLFGKSA